MFITTRIVTYYNYAINKKEYFKSGLGRKRITMEKKNPWLVKEKSLRGRKENNNNNNSSKQGRKEWHLILATTLLLLVE